MNYLLALLLVTSACGGDGATKPDAPRPDAATDAAAIDAAIDAPAQPVGDHHHYIVAGQHVPRTNSEAIASALDLDGDMSVDNQLGKVFSTLSGQGFDIQTGVDLAVDRGTTLMLLDIQTTSFASASSVGVTTYDGANPAPPPCSGPGDTVCRHHLGGTGAFDVKAGSPHEIPLVGAIASSTLTAGPGKLVVPVGVFGGVTLELVGARVKIIGASATGAMSAIVAGGVTQNDLDTKVYPAFQTDVMASVTRDCNDLQNPPTCGCTAGTSGQQMLSLFDTAPANCTISVEEIKNNGLIQALFAPDILVEGQMVVSFGMTVDAVPGTFTP